MFIGRLNKRILISAARPAKSVMTVKPRAEDTGGTYAGFEDLIPPGAGPPLHTAPPVTPTTCAGERRAERDACNCVLNEAEAAPARRASTGYGLVMARPAARHH